MANELPENFFINDAYINHLLHEAHKADDAEINAILDRAAAFQGLGHKDVAALLMTEKAEHIARIFQTAGAIKEHIYGERIVMFAPLYISDHCINKCDYCGFRRDNQFARKRLSQDEIRREVEILEGMGHKRLALEAGEDPVNCPIDYVLESLRTIYSMKFENGSIRRVNVNIAATTVENYKKLKEAEIGTYILFQETYHKATYEAVHLAGPKKNYLYHATAFDRAMEAGIDDVGGGVLFGLYDWRYEALGLMLHNEHLEKNFGVGFHTISVPRLCDSSGNDRESHQHLVDDETFKRLVAIIRLAVPYTGMIVSTRESPAMRKELIRLGVSQISGGSAVEVGGYALREKHGSQFALADDRSAQDIISWLLDEQLIPSFCTACYRQGRTGDRFMELAKSGCIKDVCLPNALLTLKEYALDYGTQALKNKAGALIEKKVETIGNSRVRELTLENLKRLEQGQRDLYF